MTISSSNSEKSFEEEKFSSSFSSSSHHHGAETKETEVVLAKAYEANDLITTTTTTTSSLFQRHATAKTSSCIEDGKRNAVGFEEKELFGQGIAKLQFLGVGVGVAFASIFGLKLSSKGKPLHCFACVSSVVSRTY
jgi:hypothetical protein